MNAIRNLSIAAATVAFAASSAFAAQPAAGEGPFFAVTGGQSTSARQAVTQAPLAGEQPFVAVAAQPSKLSREDVRAQAQTAVAHGSLQRNGEIL